MSILFFQPRSKATDIANEAIPGAFLSFYATGTSTLQPVWANAELSTQLTNPVKADANGLFPAIYLNDALPAYKVVLQYPDANDPTVPGALAPEGLVDPYNVKPSAQGLGSIIFPITQAERDAGVTPTDYLYQDSPERYGALGGTADDSEALKQWVSVQDVRRIRQMHKCNEVLVGPKNFTLISEGGGIDFSGSTGSFPANKAFDFSKGTHVAMPKLSSNVSKGAKTLAFLTDHGCAPGSIIRINNPDLGSWSGFDDQYTAGEYVTVSKVIDSLNVRIMEGLKDSYVAADCNIHLLDYGTVNISGRLKIKGRGTNVQTITLFLSNIAHSEIDVDVDGGGDKAIDIRHSYDCRITGRSVHYYSDTVGAQQYGVVGLHCQDVTVDGEFHGERHAVVFGGTTGGGIVNRNCRVSGFLKSAIRACFDLHGNCENCGFDGGVLDGMFAIGGNNNYIRNAQVIGNAAIEFGQIGRWREMKGCNFELSNIEGSTLADPNVLGSSTGLLDIGGNNSTTMTTLTTLDGTIRMSNVHLTAPNATAAIIFRNRGSTAKCSIDIDQVRADIHASTAAADGLVRLDAVTGNNFQNYRARGLTGTDGLVRSRINFAVNNIIEEYEQLTSGSYVPVLNIGGASTGITYNAAAGSQVGWWELDGNKVNYGGRLRLSSKGVLTGDVTITLPLEVLDVPGANFPGILSVSGVSFADFIFTLALGSTTTLQLYEVTNAGVRTTIDNTNLVDTSIVEFSGWYFRAY